MFAREKLLTGVGLALSAAGALATSYAVNDMRLNPELGIRVGNACDGEQATARLVCGPTLVVPNSVVHEVETLTLGVILLAGGAYGAIRSTRRLDNYQGLMDGLFKYVDSKNPSDPKFPGGS
jgi:hypothetical protein